MRKGIVKRSSGGGSGRKKEVSRSARAKKEVKERWRKLKEIDVAAKGERCVILAADEIKDQTTRIAWYPEKGEAGLLTNNLSLPPAFVPVDSCAGFVCGVNSDFLNRSIRPDWLVRLAVSNPVTGYLAELPVLDLSHIFSLLNWKWPVGAFKAGHFALKMTPPTADRLFSVHALTSLGGTHAVYSFDFKTWLWEQSEMSAGPDADRSPGSRPLVGEMVFLYRSLRCYDVARRQWMVGPGPESGKAWDADYPLPDSARFDGLVYREVYPFRYGEKIMAACAMSGCSIVLLELIEGFEEGACKWQVMSAVDDSDFHGGGDSVKPIDPWPLVRGDLVVLPSCFACRRPVAYHLGQRRWFEIPRALVKVDLQRVFVYEP